jgi:SecD/SecF fusion protein
VTIFGVGRLAIYYWEANVIGPQGVQAPADPTVTGGPGAGHASALSLYDAVRRAARRPTTLEADNSRIGSLFYASNPKSKQVYTQSDSTPRGAATHAQALAAMPASLRGRARVYEVKPDTVIVGAKRLNTGDSVGSRYVLRDDIALRGAQIANPQQRHDEGPGATGEPVVMFDFTAEGRTAWQRLTRELADRGSHSAGKQSDTTANQHFAIAVDADGPRRRLRMNPEGIDPRTGSQISGAFTIASARQLAVLLAGDPLPAPLKLTTSRTAP